MEQLERLRLKHGLKQVSQPARCASSAILSRSRGHIVFCRNLLWHLLLGSCTARIPGKRRAFSADGEQHSRDLLDDRRTNQESSLRERSLRDDHRTILFLIARQSNLL